MVGQTGFFSLGKVASLGEEKFDLVSYPARAEGLEKIDR